VDPAGGFWVSAHRVTIAANDHPIQSQLPIADCPIVNGPHLGCSSRSDCTAASDINPK
jgi:hypothetical protein